MRGIPKELKTREDVYNTAMDLPVDQARTWLAGLTAKDVAGIMSAEELAIMKSQVAVARWPANAVTDRLAALQAELAAATRENDAAKKAHAHAVEKANRAGQRLRDCAVQIQEIQQRLVALGEMSEAIREEVDQAIAFSAALLSAASAGDDSIRTEDKIQRLNAVLFLKGGQNNG
jgi:uncharacterized protein (DUF3084 family)